ncbi:MAG: hypothetical protein J4F39_01505 [Candidatus Latescibacteria bacterium]|nr:hypothetical protein [Candidatus Latescibacterota bacterium]
MSTRNAINVPTVPFGEYNISRLIMGDNPIYGYSHFNQLLSEHQREANTSDQVMATLRRAEEVGINAWQNTLTERSAADLQRYRDEGGAIHYFCLSGGGNWYEDPSLIDEAARHGPIGMAPHGSGVAGRCLKENRLGHLRDILKRIRNTGAMVGLSVHNPRLIDIAEAEDWDIDYYMTALYYLEGAQKEFERKFGYPPLGEIYLREHRDRMCRIIRNTAKPCIVFKVLAAGRTINSKDRIREEFGFALNNIKTSDVLLVGMYQKFNDQLGENAATVADLCRA